MSFANGPGNAQPSAPARRLWPAAAGISAGVVAVAANYAAHLVLPVPLLPEQAGEAFLRVLPLRAFSAILRLFGPRARPILLVCVTLLLVLVVALATTLVIRLRQGPKHLFLGALVVLLVGAVASAATPVPVGDVILEAVILSAAAGLTLWAWISVIVPETAQSMFGRRQFLRGFLFGSVGLAALSLGYIDVRRLLQSLVSTGPGRGRDRGHCRHGVLQGLEEP